MKYKTMNKIDLAIRATAVLALLILSVNVSIYLYRTSSPAPIAQPADYAQPVSNVPCLEREYQIELEDDHMDIFDGERHVASVRYDACKQKDNCPFNLVFLRDND